MPRLRFATGAKAPPTERLHVGVIEKSMRMLHQLPEPRMPVPEGGAEPIDSALTTGVRGTESL